MSSFVRGSGASGVVFATHIWWGVAHGDIPMMAAMSEAPIPMRRSLSHSGRVVYGRTV